MQPKFSNFAVFIIAVAAVSIAEKLSSIIKVGIAGYPPPRPIVQYKTQGSVDEDQAEPQNDGMPQDDDFLHS